MFNRFRKVHCLQGVLGRIFVSLLLLAPPSSFCAEFSSDLTYRSNVSEVRLVFFVKDEHNRPVPQLQADDFAVIDEDDIIRHFRSFDRASLMHLNVVIALDSSSSVSPQYKTEVAEALHLMSRAVWNGADNVSVIAFGGFGAQVACQNDCRDSTKWDRFTSPAGGTTPLYDAIERAIDLLNDHSEPDAWPLIILFSDGDDTISRSSLQDVLRELQASEAQIYAIDVGVPGRGSNGSAVLQKLADESGGRRIAIANHATESFDQIFEDLHSAHIVTYKLPKSSSQFHHVQILPTHNLKLQFRCRRGYYHPGRKDKEDGL